MQVVLAMTVALPGQAASAQTSAPLVSLTGILSMVMGDTQDRSGEHRSVYAVADDRGQQHSLAVSDAVAEAAGGLAHLAGKRVTVRGVDLGQSRAGGPRVISASSIEVAAGPSASPEALAGSQRFVTILCRFADATAVTPKSVAYMEGLLGDTYPGISDFWRENSYGLINNAGSVVVDWLDLPLPRASYLPGGNLDHDRAAKDCTGAADPTVNFNDYVGINLVFNQTLDCCAWGGTWGLSLDGTYRGWPMTWMPPWGVSDQSVLAHEMGHAYGLPHSSGNYGAVYDSRWDVMSWGGRALGTADPVYGRLGTQTISYHKDSLGWIPAARKYTAGADSCQEITIDRLAQVPATTGTYLMAQVPTTANRFYTVEARRSAGYDGGGRLPGEAIVIHDVLTTRREPAHVVDGTLNNDPNDAGARWVPGETFTDATNGVTIEVVAATSAGWSVRITRGAASCATASTAGTFTALTPARILDTRTGTGACTPSPCTYLAEGGTLGLQVSGAGSVPATGVSAVVMNVTVTEPTAPSVLTVYPSDASRPTASNLNYSPGETVPNLVTVKLGADGKVNLHNAFGTVHVIADVAGWYSDGTTPAGSRYNAVTPARVLDTRNGTGTCSPSPCAVLGNDGTLGLQVAGTGGLPSSGATAVVMNVTVTGPSAASVLTAYPSDAARPTVSNLNYSAGQTVPNLVTVRLGADGRVNLHNAFGTAHVIADVAGWYGPAGAATGSRFIPVAPARILDTRAATGTCTPGPCSLVGPDGVVSVQLAAAGGVPASGASAVVMNITVTQANAASVLTAYPSDASRPTASSLNYSAGQTLPNLVAVRMGADGRVNIHNAFGSTHVIADVAGWFDDGSG